MGQDATKVLLGATGGTFKNVEAFSGNLDAGLACVQKSDGTVTSTLADGALLGVSLGVDMSGTAKFFSIVRKGSRIPIQLGDGFTPVIGAQVQLHATSGQAVASGTAVNATFSSSTLTGVKEDGNTCNVAYIEIPGGF